MTAILASVAIVAALAGCGPATITTADGWVLPDLPHETRCTHDAPPDKPPLTLCVDRVTGERYLNGQRVAR